MIHKVLQFALLIALRYALHRYETQDIHRQESYLISCVMLVTQIKTDLSWLNWYLIMCVVSVVYHKIHINTLFE